MKGVSIVLALVASVLCSNCDLDGRTLTHGTIQELRAMSDCTFDTDDISKLGERLKSSGAGNVFSRWSVFLEKWQNCQELDVHEISEWNRIQLDLAWLGSCYHSEDWKELLEASEGDAVGNIYKLVVEIHEARSTTVSTEVRLVPGKHDYLASIIPTLILQQVEAGFTYPRWSDTTIEIVCKDALARGRFYAVISHSIMHSHSNAKVLFAVAPYILKNPELWKTTLETTVMALDETDSNVFEVLCALGEDKVLSALKEGKGLSEEVIDRLSEIKDAAEKRLPPDTTSNKEEPEDALPSSPPPKLFPKETVVKSIGSVKPTKTVGSAPLSSPVVDSAESVGNAGNAKPSIPPPPPPPLPKVAKFKPPQKEEEADLEKSRQRQEDGAEETKKPGKSTKNITSLEDLSQITGGNGDIFGFLQGALSGMRDAFVSQDETSDDDWSESDVSSYNSSTDSGSTSETS